MVYIPLVFPRHPQPFASNPSTVAAGPSGADVNATKEVRFQDLVGFVGATAPDLRGYQGMSWNINSKQWGE